MSDFAQRNAISPSTSTTVAFYGALATIAALISLHVLSPEFNPSWRVVSEYANGAHGWMLSLMFLLWAASSWALAYALRPLARSWVQKIGVVLLAVAGFGEAMAAVFDINHPLHMLAAVLGMNGLPIAALLIGISFSRANVWGESRSAVLWLSHFTWLSVALMAASMFMFFSALSSAGITMSPESPPLERLPEGVSAWNGWANRVLIVIYCLWSATVAWALTRSRQYQQNA